MSGTSNTTTTAKANGSSPIKATSTTTRATTTLGDILGIVNLVTLAGICILMLVLQPYVSVSMLTSALSSYDTKDQVTGKISDALTAQLAIIQSKFNDVIDSTTTSLDAKYNKSYIDAQFYTKNQINNRVSTVDLVSNSFVCNGNITSDSLNVGGTDGIITNLIRVATAVVSSILSCAQLIVTGANGISTTSLTTSSASVFNGTAAFNGNTTFSAPVTSSGAVTCTGTFTADTIYASGTNGLSATKVTCLSGNANQFSILSNSGSVTLTLPDSGVTSYSLNLPPVPGSANQVLTNDGLGSSLWANPSLPAGYAEYHASVNSSLVSGTAAPSVFDTKIFNTGSFMTATGAGGTNNSFTTFTNTSGSAQWWNVNYTIAFAGTTTATSYYMWISLNGGTFRYGCNSITQSNTTVTFCGSSQLYVPINGYVQVIIYQNSGAAMNAGTNSGNISYIMIRPTSYA